MTGEGRLVVDTKVDVIVDSLPVAQACWVVHIPFLLRIPRTRSITSCTSRIHVLPTASTRLHQGGLAPDGRSHRA